MGRTGDIRYRSSPSPDLVADTKATVVTRVQRLVRARKARIVKASSTGPAKRRRKPRRVPTPVVSTAGMPRTCSSEMLSLAEYSNAVENRGAVTSVGGERVTAPLDGSIM